MLDLGSDQEQNPTAGLTFEQGTDGSGDATVTVTVVDPGNVDSLALSGDIYDDGTTLQDDTGTAVSDGGWDGSGAVENTDVSAGDTATVPDEALSSTTGTVQVTGTVGTSSALIDSYEYDFS